MSVLNPAILYEPERGKATVDIVFVHGLGGDALKTWTRESCCWPRDLLKDDFPDARIMTWGYDSSVAKLQEPSSQTSIFDHAESLLNSVSRARDGLNKKERPIIFVCHSLGGLVTKQALIRASEYLHNNQDHRLGAIFTYTTGVIFMGTPHRGSDKTPLGHIAAAVAKVMLRQPSRKLLKILEKDSDILEHQRRSFDSIKEQLFIVCLHCP
ncbi:Alpha/Beta hydrolase protein [Hypomontagnella monticulosa]|nr:Alpha/Beta hydrolase protein [Hypomontagnella monticulosa]